jgi:thiamine-phosphate pyrophosphorylase
MRIIIITSPDFIPGEDSHICRLLDSGAYRVHLRKPSASIGDYESLIRKIPKVYLDRIVIHDYFSLCVTYHLAGIHLNSRCHDLPAGFRGSVSCSCHSIDEIVKRKLKMDYLFLSPIFDSISKMDYHSAFSVNSIRNAAAHGFIDSKVMALGGVTFSRLDEIRSLSFGGAVMLGEIWKDNSERHIIDVCQNIRKYAAP